MQFLSQCRWNQHCRCNFLHCRNKTYHQQAIKDSKAPMTCFFSSFFLDKLGFNLFRIFSVIMEILLTLISIILNLTDLQNQHIIRYSVVGILVRKMSRAEPEILCEQYCSYCDSVIETSCTY